MTNKAASIHEDSCFIEHVECPHCGSSDANGLYDDGHLYCYSCKTRTDAKDAARLFKLPPAHSKAQPKKVSGKFTPVAGEYVSLTKRKITQRTCELLDYKVGRFNGKPIQLANYYDNSNSLVGQKIRFRNKDFTTIGKVTGSLFGMHRCSGKGKRITITEGEIDALTVFQEVGAAYTHVVSVPNGASGARKAISANIEFLSGYDEVILMLDNDEPGLQAAKECAELHPGKMKIATLPLKDPNEMLVEGRGAEIIHAIWNAKTYRPDGIIAGKDMLERLMCRPVVSAFTYPWECVQEATLGLRIDEIVTITAGSGMGKSQIAKEIGYHLLNQNVKIGWMCLEESAEKTADLLIGFELNRRIHLLPQPYATDGYIEAYKKTVGRVDESNESYCYLFDHFGGVDEASLYAKIRYFATYCDCKFIILDHISLIASANDDKDERKLLDKLMTDLGVLCRELHIGIITIVHLRRTGENKGHEDGAKTSLGQLRGSGGIAQLSDIVFSAERNQQHKDKKQRSVITVRGLKNRFEGTTGAWGQLQFSKETGRIIDVTPKDFTDDDDSDGSGFTENDAIDNSPF